MEDCLPWERPHTGAGKECEEEVAEELLWTDLPSGNRGGHRGVRSEGVKLCLGRRGKG